MNSNKEYKTYLVIFKNGEFSIGVCLKEKYLSEICGSYFREKEGAELHTLFVGNHPECKYVANRALLVEYGNPLLIRERGF
jgi:hypothetical protein